MTKYLVAEKFKSLQGEGLYTGTPMAFIRFVGCSVGKRVCHYCDTDFDKTMPWRGGGEFDGSDLIGWVMDYDHICLTGGEPLDQDLTDLLEAAAAYRMFHIETSGTKPLPEVVRDGQSDLRLVGNPRVWVCVSPKPGYIEEVVMQADEVKVIAPGLGNGPGWPTLEDALRWAAQGKLVYLQPQNAKFEVDKANLMYVLDILREYPQLRLSTQAHKILKVQ